jgi:hypothetical protein
MFLFEVNRLENADLRGCLSLSESCLRLLSNCTWLRRLDLSKCYQVLPLSSTEIFLLFQTARRIFARKFIHYCGRFTAVLPNSKQVRDETVEAICRGCTRLNYLDLSFLSHLSDVALRAVACHATRLQTLNIVKCTSFSENAIGTSGMR